MKDLPPHDPKSQDCLKRPRPSPLWYSNGKDRLVHLQVSGKCFGAVGGKERRQEATMALRETCSALLG